MTGAEVVPGTIHLVDLEGTLRVKHASGSQQDVVLDPAPSDDPDDPLNWSAKRKLLLTTSISLYTFAIGIASAATYSVYDAIEKDTGLTLDELNRGTGYMFLLFGWGCLFWQPLAVQYGKRPIYLISTLATTYFTHERGTYIAVYGFFLAASNFLAPLFAGFINDGQGWKWVLYWCAILSGASFIFLFFSLEETNYHRKVLRGGQPTSNGEGGSQIDVSDSFEKNGLGSSAERVEEGRPGEKTKSYYDKLKLFDKQALRYPKRLKSMAIRPLIFLTFPVILYAGFSYGSYIVWFNVLNGTTSLILSEKPYVFTTSIVGLAYIAPFLGLTIGTLYTSQVGNWVILELARRNRGIMQSEYRLWLFTPSVLLLPGGLILWGVGAAHHVHWFGLVFAMGLMGFTNIVGLQLSVSYCIDSYRELSAEALVTVILVRNTMSFAMGYGITPWVTDMGLQNAFVVAAFASLAQVLTVFVFIRYGQDMRRASIGRYERYKEEMVVTGLAH
ncbi:MAG: hypothetical protein Q9225_004914 [Loekoesia sp. 1 TL-2023]